MDNSISSKALNGESNSAFISYRRSTSWQLARAIYMDLQRYNIDTFLDFDSIGPGQFDTIILNQIAARPYFLPLLTPGALDRCANPGDWVLREIEQAMTLNRVVIPLYTSDFKWDDLNKFLPESVAAELSRFNGIEVHQKYFDAAMAEMRRFLIPININVTPTPKAEQAAVAQIQQQVAVTPASKPPMSAEDYYERGRVNYNAHDYDAAIADCNEAIRLDSQYVYAYGLRGRCYAAKGDNDTAIKDYDEAIWLDSQYVYGYYYRGLAYAAKGNTKGAIADYQQVLGIRPDFIDARAELDTLKKQAGQKTPTAVLTIEPTVGDYLFQGRTAYRNGDYDAAIDAFTEASRQSPQNAEIYYRRGLVYYAKGAVQEAIEDYTDSIILNGQAADTYYQRGVARLASGDREGAIEDFNHTLQLAPDHPNVRQSLDWLNHQSQSGLLSAPDDQSLTAEDYVNRSNLHYFKKEFREAITDLDKAISLNPQFAYAYFDRARAYNALGDRDNAIADYQQALKLKPDLSEAQRGLDRLLETR